MVNSEKSNIDQYIRLILYFICIIILGLYSFLIGKSDPTFLLVKWQYHIIFLPVIFLCGIFLKIDYFQKKTWIEIIFTSVIIEFFFIPYFIYFIPYFGIFSNFLFLYNFWLIIAWFIFIGSQIRRNHKIKLEKKKYQ